MPSLLIFAHTPPPLHGQSLMVAKIIETLTETSDWQIFHVNARFSDGEQDVGTLRAGKFFNLVKFVLEAIQIRLRFGVRTIYYVPAPPKLSAVIRDFLILTCLRPFFPNWIFHWHAVGLGRWVEGQLAFYGPRLPDSLATLMRMACKWTHSGARLSISISQGDLADACVFRPKLTAVIPNGIADPWPDPVTAENGLKRRRSLKPYNTRRVLFLSRLTRAKGIFEALAAIRQAATLSPKIQWLFTIAGDFANAQEEKEIEATLALPSPENAKIHLQGFLSDFAKEEAFATHDLLLFPSHTESFGLVALEALARGVPVIGTRVPGLESVLAGTGCPLVPVGDVAALAQALLEIKLPFDPAPLRAHFLKHFTLDIFKNRISRTLREACG